MHPLVVTFEPREAAREYVAETGLGWPLLVDTERDLYGAYGMGQARWRHLWGFATMRAYWREARQGRFPRVPRADTGQQGGNVLIDPAGIVRLHHVGLGELAVDTPEAYVASARDLAGNLERRRSLRAGLRERVAASLLCDAPAYARSVEDAYRDLWRKWCAGHINTP